MKGAMFGGDLFFDIEFNLGVQITAEAIDRVGKLFTCSIHTKTREKY